MKYPVLLDVGAINWNNQIDVEDLEQKVAPGAPPARKKITVPRYDVIIQFVWQEVLPSQRNKPAAATPTVATVGVAAAGLLR